MSENKNFLGDSRRKNWFWDYNDVFNSSLSAPAILVRLYLARCADATTRKAFPSIKNIAEHCKLSRSTVKRAINELIEKGWITKESRRNEEGDYDTNIYTLCDPPSGDAPDQDGNNQAEEKGGRLTMDLPCSEATPSGDEAEKGRSHSEPTVGSQKVKGWVQREPRVGSDRATNNTSISNTQFNVQQQNFVVVDSSREKILSRPKENSTRGSVAKRKEKKVTAVSPELVEDVRTFAEENGIGMPERFAAWYISLAGGAEAAKELIATCASFIEREIMMGRKVRSVPGVLINAARNFVTGMRYKSKIGIVRLTSASVKEREEKYRDLYVNSLDKLLGAELAPGAL